MSVYAESWRCGILRAHGATGRVMDELLRYIARRTPPKELVSADLVAWVRAEPA
jgi:hypothetical protein